MIDKDVEEQLETLNIDDIVSEHFTLSIDSSGLISNEVAPGYWKVNPQFWIYTPHRPNMINRFFVKLLLGWEWFENDNNKKY
jgi:hypothetical protein